MTIPVNPIKLLRRKEELDRLSEAERKPVKPKSTSVVRQLWEAERERAERLIVQRYYGEKPGERDEAGRFGAGGGGGGGESAESKPAASSGPPIRVASDVSKAASARVEWALEAIPAAHREALKDEIKINLDKSTEKVIGPISESATSQGLWFAKQIYLAEEHRGTKMLELEGVTVHELGHAVDGIMSEYKYSDSKAFMKALDNDLFERANDYEKYQGGMNDRYLNIAIERKEPFAEMYRLAYNPSNREEARYFGGLTRERAEEIFKESLAYVKSL